MTWGGCPGKETAMSNAIQWETDWTKALARAAEQQRPVHLFFHNPG